MMSIFIRRKNNLNIISLEELNLDPTSYIFNNGHIFSYKEFDILLKTTKKENKEENEHCDFYLTSKSKNKKNKNKRQFKKKKQIGQVAGVLSQSDPIVKKSNTINHKSVVY